MIVSRFLCVSLSLFSSFSFYFLLSLWGPIYVCAAITASFCLFLCSSLFISVSCFLPYPSLSPSRGCCALWVPLSTPTTPRSRSLRGAIPLGAIPLLATRWQKRASLRVARPGGSAARTLIGTEPCQSQRLPKRGGAPEPLPGQWGNQGSRERGLTGQ